MVIFLLLSQQKRSVFHENTEREASEDLLVCEQFDFFPYCLRGENPQIPIKNRNLQNDRRALQVGSWVSEPLCPSSCQLTRKGKLCLQMTWLWLQSERSSQ